MTTADSNYLSSRRVGVLDLFIRIITTTTSESLSSARRTCEYQLSQLIVFVRVLFNDLISDGGEGVIPGRKLFEIFVFTTTSPDLRIRRNCPRVYSVPHAFEVEN